MRTAAMLREYTGKPEEVRELKASRKYLIEMDEIDRENVRVREIAGERRRRIKFAKIDQKILTAMITDSSVTEIEVDSSEVDPHNLPALFRLGFQVERLPSEKTTISWKLVVPEATSE